MGWVSYLEDITDRLTQDLEQYRELARSENASSAQGRVQVESLLAACDNALEQIRGHLELATDPEFDMAFEISELDKEKAKLELEVSSLETRRTKLRTEIERLQSEGKSLKLDVRTLQRQISLKEDEMNRILTQNPEIAYEVYSAMPEDQR